MVMVQISKTSQFNQWLGKLRDRTAVARIAMRIDRLEGGNAGDAEPVGEGVSEMRIHHGPGYRVYFVNHGDTIIVLLCGGDKSTQSADIRLAKELARNL